MGTQKMFIALITATTSPAPLPHLSAVDACNESGIPSPASVMRNQEFLASIYGMSCIASCEEEKGISMILLLGIRKTGEV